MNIFFKKKSNIEKKIYKINIYYFIFYFYKYNFTKRKDLHYHHLIILFFFNQNIFFLFFFFFDFLYFGSRRENFDTLNLIKNNIFYIQT